MKNNRIAIIGGGAAGMMAAITAARAGSTVVIYERNNRIGKKILATGNGKCNLGNKDLTPDLYYGGNKKFIDTSLRQFGVDDTIHFFHSIGLMIKEKNGYLYPLSEQASTVLDVLRGEIQALGIKVVIEAKVNLVSPKGADKWEVGYHNSKDAFDKVIIACGSKAAPKTGSDGSGYKLANQLGIKLVPTVPALVQLRCSEEYCKMIAGVRCDAQIRLFNTKNKSKELARERGELQLTEYGISGIPIFQLSRIANYQLRDKEDLIVVIDFLPDYSEEAYQTYYENRISLAEDKTVEEFFTGMLHKKLMTLFIKLSGLKNNTLMKEADVECVKQVFDLCKSFCLHVVGSNSYDNAQVCAGGVSLEEITYEMEAKKAKGIYFVGEVLDVDGRCGGYNLQWAWTSGYIAGMAATI